MICNYINTLAKQGIIIANRTLSNSLNKAFAICFKLLICEMFAYAFFVQLMLDFLDMLVFLSFEIELQIRFLFQSI